MSIMETCPLSEDTWVAKFNVNNETLYGQVLWINDNKDMFHIKIFFHDNTWEGKFSNELAAKRREKLDQAVEEYNANVKESLSGNSEVYVHDFIRSADDTNAASFVWKKKCEGALQIHGIVPVEREGIPTSKDILINILLEQNRKLISDIDTVSKINGDLQKDLTQYSQKLEELIEVKSSLELTLYGRFIQVLNEKKKRIQSLQDHINSL